MTLVPPGGTIGIIGGGQLGRMLALEARRLGYRVAIMSERPGPAAEVADVHVAAPLEDLEGARALAARADVVTLETEHVSPAVLSAVAERAPVCPGPEALATVQDRLRQRELLRALGLPQPAHASVPDAAALAGAARALGLPAILKSRRGGYDGRGQARIDDAAGLADAWTRAGERPAVLEAWVPFARELSVLVARDRGGAVRAYPLAENRHEAHVLHLTRAPARVSAAAAAQAEEIARVVGEALEYVGVLAVELFELEGGRLLVNEIAPRVHNSGHFTWGGCVTSQFEQHVRAIAGLPLGDPTLLRPTVMLNLLGDLWAGGEPDWTPVLAHPGARLHLYGKTDARPGRKMGHLLLFDEEPERAIAAAQALERALGAGATGTGGRRTPRAA